MNTVTINPTHLATLTHLSHKEGTRYAMRGVAVDEQGNLAATDGKCAGRIGPLSGDVIVVGTDTVKSLLTLAKRAKRGPELAITLRGNWGMGEDITATVHRADSPDDVRATTSFTSEHLYFPDTEAVYAPEKGGVATVGLDFALLERIAKSAKALGGTVGRITFSVERTATAPIRVEFRVDGVTLEIRAMPVRLA